MTQLAQSASATLYRVAGIVAGSFEGMHGVEYRVAESLGRIAGLRAGSAAIPEGRAHAEGMKAVCRALDLSDEMAGEATVH